MFSACIFSSPPWGIWPDLFSVLLWCFGDILEPREPSNKNAMDDLLAIYPLCYVNSSPKRATKLTIVFPNLCEHSSLGFVYRETHLQISPLSRTKILVASRKSDFSRQNIVKYATDICVHAYLLAATNKIWFERRVFARIFTTTMDEVFRNLDQYGFWPMQGSWVDNI